MVLGASHFCKHIRKSYRPDAPEGIHWVWESIAHTSQRLKTAKLFYI